MKHPFLNLSDAPHRASQRLLRLWAPQCATVQCAGVVSQVHQQVKACGGWEGLTFPWAELVGAAQPVVSGHELTLRAEIRESMAIRDFQELCSHVSVRLNPPPCSDDFSDRGIQVQLGDKAVHYPEEKLSTLLGLQFQLAHCVHVSDGIHCRDKVGTTHSLTSTPFCFRQEQPCLKHKMLSNWILKDKTAIWKIFF